MYNYNIYDQETSICICIARRQKDKKYKVYLTNFIIILILSHFCE